MNEEYPLAGTKTPAQREADRKKMVQMAVRALPKNTHLHNRFDLARFVVDELLAFGDYEAY